MKLKHLKLDSFYLRKAFLEYHQGWRYVCNRYVRAQSITAHQMPFEPRALRTDLTTHVLTGRRDFTIMLWALASMYRVMDEAGRLFIHSDGTLGEVEFRITARLFPGAVIITPNDFEKRYRSTLEAYPEISRWRFEQPHFFLLKKLIDPYFVSHTPLRLIIDSDVLWFQKPTRIEEEIRRGAPTSLIMTNASPAYVYFRQGGILEKNLASFNSGIVLYHKDKFDLTLLEQYLARIDEKNKNNIHFIEQAGYASCLHDLEGLPMSQYHIKGALTGETIVKHYTSPRRPLLYTEGIDWLTKLLL